jgi:hypothetical protein
MSRALLILGRPDIADKAKTCAECGRLFGEHLCKAVHSGLYHPHAVLFDVRHEHQGCGREVWRRSAIGRVTPEELSQPLVLEVLAQGLPEAVEGFDAP